MSATGKALIEIVLAGADAAKRGFESIGAAGKKAGFDINDAFKSAGAAVANFSASAVDAVVDVQAIDPATLVKGFEDYARVLTKTSLATGQSLTDLRDKYTSLARINAVMPQQIDAFAKSVGKLTYDVKGAQSAFTGAHDAALMFNQTDMEQVPMVAMFKNLGIAAGDTTQAVGKIVAQANKLGTVGGAWALRDLFVELLPVIDQTVSKLGNGVAKAQGFAAALTAGLQKNAAVRVTSSSFGYLQSNGMALWKQFGENPFDEFGKINDKAKWYSRIIRHDLTPVDQGGRGMSPTMVQMALYGDLGPETGARMWRLASGAGVDAKATAAAAIAPVNTAQKLGIAYRSTPIGRLDAARFEQWEYLNHAAEPLFNDRVALSKWVSENPVISAVASSAIKQGLLRALPTLAEQAWNHPVAAAITVAGMLVGQPSGKDDNDAAIEGMLPSIEAVKARNLGPTQGPSSSLAPTSNVPVVPFGNLAKDIVDELHSRPIPIQPAETTATQAESDKHQGSRNTAE